jgi:carboxynorspermidine decarboxylase
MEQYRQLPLPCYLLEEKKLRQNLELIRGVEQAAGCSIILALKGFAMWSAFPIVREYLSGCAASSYYEARLIDDYFRGHIHLYAPAYTKEEFPLLLELADRISFNSLGQWETFSAQALAKGISCGLRVNPGIHEVETDLYNPSGKQSRLGIAVEELGERLPDGVEGLHVHALCESPADATARLIAAVEDSYGRYLADLKWLNLGGGHLMTREGYDIEALVSAIRGFRERHPHIEVILEPGSAIAWRAGPLVSSVLDIVHRGGMDIAILDISATAHMPDVLEMPYRPEVRDAGEPDKKPYTCRLGGMTCLAGDVIGDYSFDEKLKVGDLVVFEDMIHYTMVKTTMFNGVQHPAIAIERTDGSFDVVRQFSYEDYRDRLS